MAKLRWFLLCLALVIPTAGFGSAQTGTGTQNDKQIRSLQAEISQMEASRKQSTGEYERNRDVQIIAVTALVTAAAVSALFIAILRRRQFFDKPVTEWLEGRKYVFPFEAYKADVESGGRRNHYGCPFDCGVKTLRRTECAGHLKEEHEAELAKL